MSNYFDLVITKLSMMIIMFLLIFFVGNIPLRSKAFNQNNMLMSFSAAFSGGLFLSVGVINLLPESNQHFIDYFQQQDNKKYGYALPHFPYCFLITVLSFSFILLIEKIAIDDHHPHHVDELDQKPQLSLPYNKKKKKHLLHSIDSNFQQENQLSEIVGQQQQYVVMKTINTKYQVPGGISLQQQQQQQNSRQSMTSSHGEQFENAPKLNLTPFILQIAMGIHAIFQGLAIGIQSQIFPCIAISLAVICHQWAQGLTLGLAYIQAGVGLKTSSMMIQFQGMMNPVGIILGWVLSSQGALTTGIFMSISAGTFLYIATLEVIAQEFNQKRFKFFQFIIYVSAVCFISSLWFVEQLAGK